MYPVDTDALSVPLVPHLQSDGTVSEVSYGLCIISSPILRRLFGSEVTIPVATPLLLRFADLLAWATVRPPTLPPLPPVPVPEGRPRLPAPVAVTVRRDFCFWPAIGKGGGSIWF